MKRLIILLMTIASSCSDSASSPESSGRDADLARIASAVLQHEASLPREDRPACLSPLPEGIALDQERQRRRRRQAEQSARSADASTVENSNRLFEWHEPGADFTRGSAALLDEAEGLQLSDTAGEIVRDPAQASPVARIKAEWVPARLRGWRPFGLCDRLSLSAPAFRGDVAFVETSYRCGGYCGYSAIYALRRRGEDWTVVATALTGVS